MVPHGLHIMAAGLINLRGFETASSWAEVFGGLFGGAGFFLRKTQIH